MNPVRESFEKIPFRNRTISELRATSANPDGAIIESENTIYFPNIFGSFTRKGITFNTCLTLVGIENPYNKKILQDSCRGISMLRKKDIGQHRVLLEFFILMSTDHCPDYSEECRDQEHSAFLEYCLRGTDRTQIFATEYLCLYRFFIETLKQAYKDPSLHITENPNRKFIHPTVKEVHDLICPFDAIVNLIQSYNKRADAGHEINSHEPFLESDLARKRKALLGFYKSALKELRVSSEIVEEATIELLSICGAPSNQL